MYIIEVFNDVCRFGTFLYFIDKNQCVLVTGGELCQRMTILVEEFLPIGVEVKRKSLVRELFDEIGYQCAFAGLPKAKNEDNWRMWLLKHSANLIAQFSIHTVIIQKLLYSVK